MDERIDFAPILSAICRLRPTLQAVLGHAELVRTGPGSVDLNVYNGSPFHQMQLKQKPIRDLIHAEIYRVLGEETRVIIHVKDGPSPHPDIPAPPKPQMEKPPRGRVPSAKEPTLYEEYLQSDTWKWKRQAALRHFDNQCCLCGSPRELNVHHKTYANVFAEKQEDLTVLCRDCHARFHGKLP